MTGAMLSANSIAFAPLLPPLWLAAAITPALLVSLYALIRRSPGAWLRLLAALVLSAILLNPALVTEQRDPLRDVAVVIADRSPSQQIGQRPAQTDAALAALAGKLAALPDLDIRTLEGPKGGDETKLFGEIDRAFADVPEQRRAGVIMLTDGQVHDIPKPEDAQHYGPVHVLLTGQKNELDRRIRITQAPSYGIVGQSVTATLIVEDMPERQDTHADLIIHDENGHAQQQQVPIGKEVSITLPVKHAGLNLTSLEVAPVEGELTKANNRAALLVNGVRDRLRVLLISDHPHNGERSWRNLFKSDPSVDLVHFTILRPPTKRDYTPENELSLIPFPVQELFAVKLREFDLVVFDRFTDRNLLLPRYLMNIVDYVRAGGAMLDASGPDLADPQGPAHSLLSSLLPSQPMGLLQEEYRPQVSAMGLRHPVTASLPGLKADGSSTWGHWYSMAQVVPSGDAEVLMTGAENAPLLLLSHFGEGRVAQLTSDQLWLWGRGHDGGGPQIELTRPLVHWLMKEPELEAEQIIPQVTDNRITLTRRTLQPDSSAIMVTKPDGVNVPVTMTDDGRVATGFLDADQPGIYRFTDSRLNAMALVGRPNAPELADQRATPDLLKPVISATHGGYFWLQDYPQGPELRRTSPGRSAAGTGWLGLVQNGDYTVTGFSSLPLLPLALAGLLAILPLLLSWRREGK